jgi:hypothetical protein
LAEYRDKGVVKIPAQAKGRRGSERRRKAVVIIGESDNDTEAIGHLFRALRSDFEGTIHARRDPPLLIKDATPEKLPGRASVLSAIIRSEALAADVVCVLAHEDCDAVEPAHIPLSQKIEDSFNREGIAANAATPAWEMETWLFLWPEASKKYRPKWRQPDRYNGTNVGMLTNAKEKFKAELRPKGAAASAGVRDYRETDAPAIVNKIRELGIIDSPSAISNSYSRFRDAVRNCDLTKNVVK